MSQAAERRRLQDDITAIVKVQDNNGCSQITVPVDVTEDLDLEEGDRVFISGAEGEQSVSVKPASTLVD